MEWWFGVAIFVFIAHSYRLTILSYKSPPQRFATATALHRGVESLAENGFDGRAILFSTALEVALQAFLDREVASWDPLPRSAPSLP